MMTRPITSTNAGEVCVEHELWQRFIQNTDRLRQRNRVETSNTEMTTH